MKRTIKVTEANNKKMITLIPIESIEYIQSSVKDSGDTHIRLRNYGTSERTQKYFFVSETVEEIEAQINGKFSEPPLIMSDQQYEAYTKLTNGH